jgi:ribulose-5-phosphate 4-epimerase/fuculose-1-phosphate aldolase
VAGSRAGLSWDNFYSAQLHDRVACHDFEGITVHADEGPRLLRSIGSKPAVILRNHGLLAWGRTIELAFVTLWTLQRACEIQIAGAALGPTIPVSDAIQRKASADALQFHPDHGGGKDVFDALVRLVDRIDTSYRD